MAAVPMKSEYGPTLGRLLAPRWKAASGWLRAAVILAGVALVAVAVGLGLTLENATYSHGGPVPFSFEYRGLYRAPADLGGLVKVVDDSSGGAVNYSYEVYPVKLPPYSGSLLGELPGWVSGYITALSRREPAFELTGEGKTKVTNKLLGYQVLFVTKVDGREMYARNVLLFPERQGVREGVAVAMLTAADASPQVKSPSEVGSTGVLLRPLKTFSFG
ncbi:MAG: hypothetical protein ACYDHN_17125 [Solirubrobacteraceae bacterium]